MTFASHASPSVIFIDLDGTLISGPFDVVWRVVLDALSAASGQERAAIYAMIEAENDSRQQDSSVSPVMAMDWDDIVRTVAAQLGVRLEAEVCALAAAHSGAPHSWVLDDGLGILRELAQPHRALVAATKGLAKYQRPVLDALGLTPLFADILTPDRHNALKKEATFFGDWPARSRLQIMVGDRYDDDVAAPLKHGFKAVWKQTALPAALANKDPFVRALLYPYGDDQPQQPDAIITTLAELPAVVRRLEQAVLGFSD